MTPEELDALEKRLREGVYSYRPGDPARAADAIAALRRELAAERERAKRLDIDAEAYIRGRDAAIARAEKAELELTEYELARDAVLCDLGKDLNAAKAEARELREALQELLDDHEYLFEKENLARMKARAALAGKGNER